MDPTDPDFDDAEALAFPTQWAVPLDEPAPPSPSACPDPVPPAPLAFTPLDAEADPADGFHPRLRRLDEAA